MAKVKIQGHASGTGVLTVTAPNTSTDRTITLPDATGTLATTADSVGGANGVDFNDSVKARFGTGNDLEIYHDGSNSYISDAGTGILVIRSDTSFQIQAANGEAYFNAVKDAETALYHNDVRKFETTATGVDVTGYLTAQEVNTHWFCVAATTDQNSDAVVDFGHIISKGSAITESGGRMTCTIAGTYLLSANFQNASDFNDTFHVYFRKNGTKCGGTIYWEGNTAGEDYSSESSFIIIQLAANDIVDVYGQGYWSGNTNNESSTTFCGIRLGE
jgi:hypothetical protein